jgi:hypothetical protein
MKLLQKWTGDLDRLLWCCQFSRTDPLGIFCDEKHDLLVLAGIDG